MLGVNQDKPKTAYIAFDNTPVCESVLKLVIVKKKIGGAGEIARLAAPKAAQMVYNTLRVGPRLILRSAFKLLRTNMITRLISVVVLLASDKFSLIRGRISVKQFIINVALALMLLVGGTAGWVLGSHALSLIMESLILGIIAGIIGAGILSAVLSLAVNKIIHLFVQDDTEDMLDIYSYIFAGLANEYKLNEDEIVLVKDDISMSRQMVRTLFTEKKRDEYALALLEPFIKERAEKREAL